jgi:hypothetical protein
MEIGLTRANRRITETVKEALLHRGFSEGGTGQMIERLIRRGETAEYVPELERFRIFSLMPFGKNAGFSLDQILTAYLLLLLHQNCFEDNYAEPRTEILEVLEERHHKTQV